MLSGRSVSQGFQALTPPHRNHKLETPFFEGSSGL
jgi:hypothetical protein